MKECWGKSDGGVRGGRKLGGKRDEGKMLGEEGGRGVRERVEREATREGRMSGERGRESTYLADPFRCQVPDHRKEVEEEETCDWCEVLVCKIQITNVIMCVSSTAAVTLQRDRWGFNRIAITFPCVGNSRVIHLATKKCYLLPLRSPYIAVN